MRPFQVFDNIKPFFHKVFLYSGACVIGLTAIPESGYTQSHSNTAQMEPGRPLLNLFAQARAGTGDPHLPFILNQLKKSLTSHDVIGMLELIDPQYFTLQFNALSAHNRSPGKALGQFSCEFLSICDISKQYTFNDIISMQVLSATILNEKIDNAFNQPTETTPQLMEIRIELRMWDGITIESLLFYDPATAKLLGAVG